MSPPLTRAVGRGDHGHLARWPRPPWTPCRRSGSAPTPRRTRRSGSSSPVRDRDRRPRRPVPGSSRSTVSYVVTHSDPAPYRSAVAAVGVEQPGDLGPVPCRRGRSSALDGSTSTQATSPDAASEDSTSGSAGRATRWTTSPDVSSTTSSTSGSRPTTQTRPPVASSAWTTADSTSTRWVISPVDGVVPHQPGRHAGHPDPAGGRDREVVVRTGVDRLAAGVGDTHRVRKGRPAVSSAAGVVSAVDVEDEVPPGFGAVSGSSARSRRPAPRPGESARIGHP